MPNPRAYSGVVMSDAPPRRILLVRPSALGDVCRTVPVLASLKRQFPEARIDWLVQEEFVEAVSGHPDLERVVPFPRRRLGRWWYLSGEGRRTFAGLVRALRGGDGARYDLAIDCQGLVRSGIFTLISGARRRVGFADARELGWMGYTERHRVESTHTVDRMLGLIEAAGIEPIRAMGLHVPPGAEVDERLRGRRYAVVAPTSRWAGKRWPADRFARVIEAMLGMGAGLDGVAIVASEGERDQCGEVLALCDRDDRVIDLVGATSVGGLMALIEGSVFVLANDSAALHMAVGFDRPFVGLFGPTRVDRVGPYGRDGDVIQAEVPGDGVTHKDDEAGRAMMERIGVDEVIEGVRRRLGVGAANLKGAGA